MTRSVAVLGTGRMGAGMARSMLRAGLPVTVWNHSRGRAEPPAAEGARVVGTPAEAVSGADAVVTMLFDGDSVADVMAQALPGLAREHGVHYVDAPVLGTRQPAEQGALVVLAAAPAPVCDQVQPLFDRRG